MARQRYFYKGDSILTGKKRADRDAELGRKKLDILTTFFIKEGMKTRILLPVCLLFVSVLAANALVVNGDLQPFGSNTYSGQAVINDPGNNFWNGINYFGSPSVSAFDLTASDGVTATTIDISFTELRGNDGGAYNLQQFGQGGSLAPALLGDYVLSQYPSGSAPNIATYTISGLTPGQTYDFIFYSMAGGSGVTNHQTFFTLENQTQYATGLNSSSFVLGTNYVEFVYTPIGSTVSGTFYRDTLNANEADFNGFQISTIAAVPEPGTWAGGLLAVSVPLIGLFRRWRSAQRS